MRRVAAFLADNLSALAALAGAGFATALFSWELGAARAGVLAGFVLTNELDPGRRDALLKLVLLGVALALLAGLAAAIVARRRDPIRALRRLSASLLPLALLPLAPILALPDVETAHPFYTMALVAAEALLAFLAARQILVAWVGATWPGWLRALADPADRRAGAIGRAGLLAAVALAAGYAVYMSVLTVARHNVFLTHSFDLGIHDQALYTLLRDGYMRSTQYGAEAINYIGDHFSPIFYLVAPLYALHQSAGTLLVLQSAFLAAGAIPVYLLARHKTASLPLALALAAGYVLYPALHGINTFDFHQLAFAPPLLLFSLYFLETDRLVPFLVSLALALITKEEMGLTVAAIGLYAWFGRRRYVLGPLLAVVGLVYFVVVVQVVMPALGGTPQVNRFAGIMAEGSTGFAGIIKTLLTNPVYTVQFLVNDPRKLIYLGQLLLPVLFLPFLGGKAWVAALPAFAVGLLTNAETQFSIAYHYSASIVPFVFFLAILGCQRLDRRRFPRAALAAAVLVASLGMNYEYGWILSKRDTGIPAPTRHQQVLTSLLRQVPAGASVSALSDLVPHLSNRENIYLFPIVNQADYIAYDANPLTNFWPYEGMDGRAKSTRALAPYLTSGEYGVVAAQDGCLLLRKGADTSANAAGLQSLFSARFEAEDQRSDVAPGKTPDPAASEGAAKLADAAELAAAAGKSALLYGPYDHLLPGKYRVTFRLKTSDIQGQDKLATIDVFSNTFGGPLTAGDVRPADFKAAGQYQDFSLTIDFAKPLDDVEYRILYQGPQPLWVDYVQITPLKLPSLGLDRDTQ